MLPTPEKIEKLLDNVTDIKEALIKLGMTQEFQIKKITEIEQEIKEIKLGELNCPGKELGRRGKSTLSLIYELGIILGVVVLILQMFGIIKP